LICGLLHLVQARLQIAAWFAHTRSQKRYGPDPTSGEE
jgi:hypothetical protein